MQLYFFQNLFLNYLACFHISQKKQLKRVLSKLEDFSNEMDHNLHNNMSFSIDDIEEDNVNRDDYLREDSDEDDNVQESTESESIKSESTKSESTKSESTKSESTKSDTNSQLITQISELDVDKSAALVQLDDNNESA